MEIIGEATGRVSPETRVALADIPWRGIIEFRNVLAHEYRAIDYQRLFTALKEGLPALLDALDHAISLIEEEQWPEPTSSKNFGTSPAWCLRNTAD